MLNRLLIDMKITAPAEIMGNIYYSDKFKKYTLPSDFRSPIGLRDTAYSLLSRKTPAIVSQYKNGEMYALQNNNGVRYVEIVHSNNKCASAVLTECDSLTADGTWTAGAGVSNIAVDTITKHSGSGSVSFNISGATATITFVKTSVVDVSDYTEHQGAGFYAWLPTAPTQITIKWGNDASNYFSKTVTKQANGEGFSTTDKNEIRALRSEATETGSVNEDNIDYFELVYSFSSSITDTDFLLDYIVMFKPEILKMEYYTSYVAQNSSGTPIQKITESLTSSDLPLVYDEYLHTLLDGLCWRYFQKKDKIIAGNYYSLYVANIAPSGALIGGLRYLSGLYPDRTQKVRNELRLPEL